MPDDAAAASRLQMQDPREQFPKPPFPKQPQAAPGLQAAMDPKPDHGETSYLGHGRLEGRKALITGGDSGIGRAAAIAYAREGADVAIAFLPSEEADAREVVDLIEAEGRKAVAIAGDIKDPAFCKALVARAVEALGGLDILVNNAGKQVSQPAIGEITSEQFDATLKTNLYAMFWITQAAASHLKPGAAIINTASVQAYEPSESLLDYATTKAGIVAFSKALSKQLISKGVRVNVVAPGPFWTALQPSGGQTQRRCNTSASTPRSAAQGNRWRSPRSMCCSPRKKPVSSPGKSTASRAGRVSPEDSERADQTPVIIKASATPHGAVGIW